jgi:hypothetical protein
MASNITFTAVIIIPNFTLRDQVLNSQRTKYDYYLDGRQLYKNEYFCETATINPSDAVEYAKDFLHRVVSDFQYIVNEAHEQLFGHLLEWTWNGRHQADDYYYPSGQYAECTWVYEGKIGKVELDKDVLSRIENDMKHQSDTFYYGRDYADKKREERMEGMRKNMRESEQHKTNE